MAKRKPKIDDVSFSCTGADRKLCRAIARRARDLLLQYGVDRDALDIDMDIVAAHCNGNPLRLQDLAEADDFNLLHDVSGIAKHLNRNTGKLEGFFSPRFSRREA